MGKMRRKGERRKKLREKASEIEREREREREMGGESKLGEWGRGRGLTDKPDKPA